ncbi:Phosphocarrier protein HPr [Buchnera aphidicola (Pterocallis alni)]|uniref:HPr family phosphocarrier protein n=1 Tax=Buchnera aphidicola TaxID=9 RepID=UPI0034649C9A
MFQKKIKINCKHGLHIRPAAQLIKYAQQFKSEINITYNDKTVNGKSLFQLQTLGISKDSIITISANGEDEQETVEKIIQFISQMK